MYGTYGLLMSLTMSYSPGMDVSKFSMRVVTRIGFDSSPRTARLDTGVEVIAPLEAEFTNGTLRITVLLDVADGMPRCTKLSVERVDGGGLELITTEVLPGLSLRRLMARACAAAVVERHEDGHYVKRAEVSLDAIEAVMGSLQRTRQPITDERLREFAEAFRERYQPGKMEPFAESLHCSPRQAWRLKKLAEERGFLLRPGATDTPSVATPFRPGYNVIVSEPDPHFSVELDARTMAEHARAEGRREAQRRLDALREQAAPSPEGEEQP